MRTKLVDGALVPSTLMILALRLLVAGGSVLLLLAGVAFLAPPLLASLPLPLTLPLLAGIGTVSTSAGVTGVSALVPGTCGSVPVVSTFDCLEGGSSGLASEGG